MPRITKVLIANRGEIAVRVIRAAKDSGIASVAVYADQDRDALHVKLADEAYALDGTTQRRDVPGHRQDPLGRSPLRRRRRAPGLRLPRRERRLRPRRHRRRPHLDRPVAGRHRAARRQGRPPGTSPRRSARRSPPARSTRSPDAAEVSSSSTIYGLPVAIKAAFGGGGRGLKVARTREEIPELFESATREAIAAFGRGECFVEKYLDEPRHVETQCLADAYGNVVVVSTRDCSLQRRHQKLVEEAPAPFLTAGADRLALHARPRPSSRRSATVGAGTCEFLIGKDGTVSFLEVNTRLQVEHPVSEEVTGIDLVREQFRIAEGGVLDYGDPAPHGHSFEFRINGEDPGRNFLPSPGPVHVLRLPGGPGVRVDSGVTTGDVITGAFDSLLAKLIVTGSSARRRSSAPAAPSTSSRSPVCRPCCRSTARSCATRRSRRRRPVLDLHALDRDRVRQRHRAVVGRAGRRRRARQRHKVVVEVEGKRIVVSLPANCSRRAGHVAQRRRRPAPRERRRCSRRPATAVKAPMQATVVKLAVKDGDKVVKGDLVLVLEAMKMEQPLTAHKDGTIARSTPPSAPPSRPATCSSTSRLSPSLARHRERTLAESTRAAPPSASKGRRSEYFRGAGGQPTMCIARAASVIDPDSDG